MASLHPPAASVRRLLPFSGIRTIFDEAASLERAGRKIHHLHVGRTDWDLPPGAADAAKTALDQGQVHYVANRGILPLREALATDIEEAIGRRFDPETELIVTSGGSEGICMAFTALLGPGDEVVIPEPAWPHYRALAQLAGATAVSLPLSVEEGFVLDPDRLEQVLTPQTRMLVLNSPSNPTGAVQPQEVLARVAALAEQHGIFVLCDDVYRHFVYEGEHHSIAEHLRESPWLIYVNSMSKSFAMTGWRIGYVACDAPISDALNRVHQYLTVCGVSFAQHGAVAVLEAEGREEWLRTMRQAFAARREVWLDALRDCPGVDLAPPGGAFYLFPRVRLGNRTGIDLARFLLVEHGIAVVPGEVFGEAYRGCIRISYGRDLETQRSAARALAEVLS